MQQTFQRYVLDGEPAIVECIAGGEGVDPARRLRIYYDAYRLRLIEALATDYEALQALLGEDEFNAACRAYVEGTPSPYRNVRWYGAGLAEFLRMTPPWTEQPLTHELALFEWTLTLAFDAPDQPVVRFEDLARLPAEQWPGLGFVLHPSVNPIELRTNAPAFRKAHDSGEPFPQISTDDGGTPWLVWRKEFTVCFRSLEEPEAWALHAVTERRQLHCPVRGTLRLVCPGPSGASRGATAASVGR